MFAKKERRGNIRKRPVEEVEEGDQEEGKSAVVQVRSHRWGVQLSVRRSLGCDRKTFRKTALALHSRQRERSCKVALEATAHTPMTAAEGVIEKPPNFSGRPCASSEPQRAM